MKIKAGQRWIDKNTGDILYIVGKHHDVIWQTILERSGKSHKCKEYVIRRYYTLIQA